MFQNLTLVALLFLPINHAYAMDDGVKSVLGGILGAILVEGVKEISKEKEENQQNEEIQWNDLPSHNSYVQNDNKEKNHYNVRLAKIQKHLKMLGFYNSNVDGLFGRNTLDAIYRWEAKYDQTIDGKISDVEFRYLKGLVDSSDRVFDIENRELSDEYKHTHKANISSENHTYNKRHSALQDSFETIEQYNDMDKMCNDFLKSGHIYGGRINLNFQERSSEFILYLETFADEQAQCLDVSTEQEVSLRKSAKKAYENTEEYRMYQLVIPMALADNLIASDIVKGCNIHISSMGIVLKNFQNKSMNQDTCEVNK